MTKEKFKKYIGKPVVALGLVLWQLILFLIGTIDRVILVFMPWLPMHSLWKKEYYEHQADKSMIRIVFFGSIGLILYLIFY